MCLKRLSWFGNAEAPRFLRRPCFGAFGSVLTLQNLAKTQTLHPEPDGLLPSIELVGSNPGVVGDRKRRQPGRWQVGPH